MPEINTVPATTPGGMPIPLSVRQRMLADQLLQQQAASTSSPILRKSTGYAKLAAGLLGGLMEGGETKHLEDQQRAAAQSLALPLNGAQSPAAAPPSADASASPMPSAAPLQSPNGAPHGASNNPGNLVDNAWTRSLPGYAGPSGRFASFSTPEAGVSALEANLGSYGKQGIGTLTDLTNRWAPKGDGSNNPTAYAASLARGLGVGPNDPINLGDPSVRAKLAPLIAGVEGNRAAPLPPVAPPPAPQAAADLPVEGASETSAAGLPPGVSFPAPQAMASQMAPASAAILSAMGPNAGNASPEDASPATPPSAPVAQPASVTAAPSDGDAAASTPPGPSSSGELDPDLMAAAAKGILNFPSSPGMSPQNAAQSSLWRAGYQGSTPSPWSGAWNGDVGSEMAREASRGAPQPSRQQMLAAALAPAPAAPDTQASPLNAAQSALWKAGYKNSTASPFTGQWGGDVGGELAREGDRGESLASMPGPDVPTIPTQPNQALASALLGNQPGGPTPPIGANIGASSDIPAMTPNAPPSPTITSDNGGGPVPVDAPIPPVRPANLGAPPPAPATPPAPRAIPPAMAATAPGSLPAPTPPPGSPSPQMLAAGLGGPTLTGRVNNSVQTPTQFNLAQGTSPSALAAALSGSPPPPAPMASPSVPQGNSGPLAALGQAAPSLPTAAASPPPAPMPAPGAAAAPPTGSNISPSGFNPYANVPNSVLAQYNAVVTNPYASPAMIEAAKERISAYMPRAVPDNSVMYNPSAPPGSQFTTMPVPHKFAQSRVPGMPPIDESTGLPAGGATAGDGVKSALQYEKDAAAAKTEGTRGAEMATPTAQTYLDAAAKIAERPSYKELSMAAPTWNAVPAMMADNSPAGDKGLIDAFGKILNPGRSVTTGAMQIIMDTQSIPEELKGAISQALTQGAHLGAQARGQMASIMQDKMDQYQKAWQGTPTVNPNTGETMYGGDRGQAIDIAKASKLDPNKAVPPIPDIAKLDLSQINTHKTPDGIQPAPAKAAPQIGTISKGHKFLGGDPASPQSWAPVQ